MTSAILRATPTDADRVAALISEAFCSLAVARWLVHDADERARVLAAYFRILVDHALSHGLVDLVADHGQTVPVSPGVPFAPGVTAWSVRWVLLHLIEETARHAGHADIIRESLDGATAFPLMAAAEGWAAQPWAQPWRRAQQA